MKGLTSGTVATAAIHLTALVSMLGIVAPGARGDERLGVPVAVAPFQWTWAGGEDETCEAPRYGRHGARGEPAASNRPSARSGATASVDAAGQAWMYGGRSDERGASSELWRIDGEAWTWFGGSDELGGAAASYGTKGVPAATNDPGPRSDAVSWTDAAGSFWLFGGQGRSGLLDDLWKFDGTSWTWMAGSATPDARASYGVLGVPGASNTPGARRYAAAWTDSSGALWLYGGLGFGVGDSWIGLADLWRFDGRAWAWMGGAKGTYARPAYGPKGVPSAASTPGSRAAGLLPRIVASAAWATSVRDRLFRLGEDVVPLRAIGPSRPVGRPDGATVR